MVQLSGVISGVRPKLLDMESSPTTVYIRSNITEREVESYDGKTKIEFVYDEIQYTFAEYAIKVAAQAQADADYAIMMTEE